MWLPLHPNFVIVGVIIIVAGKLSYLIDTIKGKTKPNKISYGLWALASLIAFTAEISQGVGIHSLLTFSVGFGPLIIFLASFVNKQAQWKLSGFDIGCGVLALVGLFLWWFTKVGNIAIAFSIAADALAALPTIIKSYLYPHTENPWSYVGDVIGAGITLLTISAWNFADIGFPIYILIINFAVSSLLFHGYWQKPTPPR